MVGVTACCAVQIPILPPLWIFIAITTATGWVHFLLFFLLLVCYSSACHYNAAGLHCYACVVAVGHFKHFLFCSCCHCHLLCCCWCWWWQWHCLHFCYHFCCHQSIFIDCTHALTTAELLIIAFLLLIVASLPPVDWCFAVAGAQADTAITAVALPSLPIDCWFELFLTLMLQLLSLLIAMMPAYCYFCPPFFNFCFFTACCLLPLYFSLTPVAMPEMAPPPLWRAVASPSPLINCYFEIIFKFVVVVDASLLSCTVASPHPRLIATFPPPVDCWIFTYPNCRCADAQASTA